MPEIMTDRALEETFPWILWREPLLVRVVGGKSTYVCRYCVAQEGLSADEVALRAGRSAEQIQEHINREHALPGPS